MISENGFPIPDSRMALPTQTLADLEAFPLDQGAVFRDLAEAFTILNRPDITGIAVGDIHIPIATAPDDTELIGPGDSLTVEMQEAYDRVLAGLPATLLTDDILRRVTSIRLERTLQEGIPSFSLIIEGKAMSGETATIISGIHGTTYTSSTSSDLEITAVNIEDEQEVDVLQEGHQLALHTIQSLTDIMNMAARDFSAPCPIHTYTSQIDPDLCQLSNDIVKRGKLTTTFLDETTKWGIDGFVNMNYTVGGVNSVILFLIGAYGGTTTNIRLIHFEQCVYEGSSLYQPYFDTYEQTPTGWKFMSSTPHPAPVISNPLPGLIPEGSSKLCAMLDGLAEQHKPRQGL